MQYRRHGRTLVLSVVSGAAALTLSSGAEAAGITVNASETYQTMKGWEAISSSLGLENASANPALIDFTVNEIGINRLRLEFSSGTENSEDYWGPFVAGSITYDQMKSHFYEKINDNDDPNVADMSGFQFGRIDWSVENEVLPMKAALEGRGESLYVAVCDVDFNTGNQGSFSHAADPDEYAELVSVLFKHLDDTYDLVPDALEITLEPENTNGWSGTQIGKAIVAATTRLHDEGYDPEIVAPSVTNASNAVPYFNDIIAVPGALAEMSMLAYHRYVPGDYAGIFQAADAHGLDTGMMEYFPGNVDHLIEDLTVANASAWEKYAVAQTNPGSDYAYVLADLSNPSSPTFSPTGPTKPLVPFFKYVRLGAVRVGATSDDGAFKPVAFVNGNGSHVVVVKANSSGTLNISGIPDATYGVFTATNSGELTDGADVVATSGTLSVDVEAGVTAVYDKATASSGGAGGAPGSGGSDSVGGSTSSGGTTNVPGSGGTTIASTGGSAATGGSATLSGGTSGLAATGGGTAMGEGNGSNADSGCACRIPGESPRSQRNSLALLATALLGLAVARLRARRWFE